MKKIFLFFCFILSLQACVKYDAEPFTGRVLPRETGYLTTVTNDWLYFNLRTGQIFNKTKPNEDIEEGEQINRLDWDLAFCGCLIRTNGGTSGKGKGAAADLGFEGYNSWKSVSQLPANLHWIVDNDSVRITMSQKDWVRYLIAHHMNVDENPWFDPNKGPATTLTSANPLLSKALTFFGPPPSYIPSFHTYVVRTADGKRFFKLYIASWFYADSRVGDFPGRISYYCEELKP